MAVTLGDIAKRAAVSAATVSRVVNGRPDPRISDTTRERVLRIATRLGYQPNPHARALVTGKTQVIAVWVASVWYPFASEVICYTQRYAEQLGYDAIVKSYEGDLERQTQAMRELMSYVDGLLVVDRPGWLGALAEGNGHARRPMVSVGVHIDEGAGDSVGVDLARGARDAVRHLWEQGCDRIAYVVPEHSNHPTEVRRMTYDRVIDGLGLEPEYIVTPRQDDICAGAHATLLEYAGDRGVPSGLFCCNDMTAIGALAAVAARGLRIPMDVAVVGCDGLEMGRYLVPPLSTIVQPVAEVCRLGIGLLVRRLEDPSAPPERRSLEAVFVPRASSQRRTAVATE